jgi:hypothetical protein
MKKIFIRSPYFVEANVPANKTKAVVKLYLWNKGTTEPTEPTYILEKFVPSPNNRDLSFNISNFAKEFIKFIKTIDNTDVLESVKNWCFLKYELFYDDVTLITSETVVCLNGFTSYQEGYNNRSYSAVIPLFNKSIKYNHNEYINFWVEITHFQWQEGTADIILGNQYNLIRLKLKEGSNILKYFHAKLNKEITIYAQLECEPIYTPVKCQFINRFGGWETLMLNKAKRESLKVESKDFKTMQSNVDYNPAIGQSQVYNLQGNKSIKINTGWVDENYSEIIENLMTSPIVLLDGKPALLKTKNFEYKTRLRDKNINYELDFDFNFGFINDVI